MIEIKFNRDRYHEHLKMIDWCRENIDGDNWGWEENVLELDKYRWYVSITFGITQFCFSKEEDAALFALRWV